MAIRPSRAESFTANKRQTENFSDFLNNFTKSFNNNQLSRVTNLDSVNQSLRNIIKTNIGERLFNPNFGSNVSNSLFENDTKFIKEDLEYNIRQSIGLFEPRAVLIDLTILTFINDREYPSSVRKNDIEVNIVYSLINNPQPIELTIILKRIR